MIKILKERNISIKRYLDNRCEFLDHSALNHKYQLNTYFLKVLQIKSCIPTIWKTKLNQCTHMPKSIHKRNIIHINNKNITIEKTTWHIINTDTDTLTVLHKWSDNYTNFHNAENNVWSRIFKFPFKTLRDTNIQTFNIILYI